MARPALVIGLGGTGQWILTYLKRDLLEAGKGIWPDGVSLRAFDTVFKPSAFVGAQGENVKEVGGKDDKVKRVGSVMLDDGIEYIHYGKYIRPMVDRIFTDDGQGNNPYRCQKWLKKSISDFLTYPEPIFQVNVGAGAIRQVGHLAFIEDIRQGEGSVIRTAIQNAVDEIRRKRTIEGINDQGKHINYKNILEVILIGSLAGGTGAGIMIDTAIWCRHLLDAALPPGGVNYRAFVVTPAAFTLPGPQQDTEMMARSFAAWRELNRFQVINKDIGSGIIAYEDQNPQMQIKLEKRLFDTTYIIDPRRTVNSLSSNEAPKDNLFPSIAHAIATILDDEAGGTFSEQAINLITTLADHKTAHNAIGAYSVKVPIYYQLEDFTFSLENEIWNTFLAPQIENGRCVDLKKNKNTEHMPADSGREAVIRKLRDSAFNYQGQEIQNTGFWQLVGQAAAENWQQDTNLQITLHAKKFPKDGNLSTHCDSGIMEKIGADPAGTQVLTDYAATERGKNLKNWITYSLDKGTTPSEGLTRIPGECDRVISNHYDDEDGTYIRILKSAGKTQIKLFALYLQAILEQELNGHDPDPVKAKGGKIGWVEFFLENLRDVLQDYQTYCEKVLNLANGNIKNDTQKNVNVAFSEYKTHAGKTSFITFWDKTVHPKAWYVERKYVDMRVGDAYFQKESALFSQHVKTTIQAREMVEATLKDLQIWKQTLGVGGIEKVDNVNQFIDSLYNKVLIEQEKNLADYQADNISRIISEKIGEKVYKPSSQDIQKQLRELEWKVRINGELGTGNEVVTPQLLEFKLNWSGTGLRKPPKLRNAIYENFEISKQKCGSTFQMMISDNPSNSVAKELKAKFPLANDLGDYLHQKAEPYWRMTTGGHGPYYIRAPRQGLLAVDFGTAQTAEDDQKAEQLYFNTVVERLNSISTTHVQHQGVNRQDPYKLTLVRFDNIIDSEDFQAYQECRDAYLNMHLDPGNLTRRNLEYFHIFPAEVNAAEFERKISRTLKLNYDFIGSECVVLLDDDQKIEMFWRAVALGFVRMTIVVEDMGGVPGPSWVYQETDNAPEIWLTNPTIGFGAQNTTDYRKLITQFAYKGRDIRNKVARTINFATLETQILKEEAANTAQERYKQLYNLSPRIEDRQQTVNDVTERIMNLIPNFNRNTDIEAPKIIYPILADLALREERDLCHLGETILRIAANDPVSPKGQAIIL